jgi:hypothetical protein
MVVGKVLILDTFNIVSSKFIFLPLKTKLSSLKLKEPITNSKIKKETKITIQIRKKHNIVMQINNALH